MENNTYLLLALYFLPMVLNMIFIYTDDEVITIEDLFIKNWWAFYIPFVNILICLLIPFYYLSRIYKEKWNKFKNIKIK